MDTYDAFISYSSKDREWVEKLVFALESRSTDVWVDFKNIKPGQKIPEQINHGLKNSTYVVFVLTPDSAESAWTGLETGYIRMASKEDRLIPVLLKECEIPPLLLPIRHIDFRNPDDFHFKVSELLEALEIPDKKREWTKGHDKELHEQGKESYIKGKAFEKEVAEIYRMLGFDVEENININGMQFDLKIRKKDTGFMLSGFVECKETRVTAQVRDQILAQHLTLYTTHPGQGHFVVSSRGYTENTKTALEAQGIQCAATPHYSFAFGENISLHHGSSSNIFKPFVASAIYRTA